VENLVSYSQIDEHRVRIFEHRKLRILGLRNSRNKVLKIITLELHKQH